MKDTIIKKLKVKGLKLTPQRAAIIEAFADKVLLHPSANTIYEEAKKKRSGISLSTIYYTLNELSKKGIINILEFEKMDNRHEGNTEAHIHLICKKCKDIIDIFPKLFRPDKIIKNVDFVVTDTRFEYYGYCAKCRDKKVQTRKADSPKINSRKK
jgi:Fe2+ or Zn2+ uptake regulation protein